MWWKSKKNQWKWSGYLEIEDKKPLMHNLQIAERWNKENIDLNIDWSCMQLGTGENYILHGASWERRVWTCRNVHTKTMLEWMQNGKREWITQETVHSLACSRETGAGHAEVIWLTLSCICVMVCRWVSIVSDCCRMISWSWEEVKGN